jgi:antitoxin (DNA-binding transcriptional repressor) of toxin-antitoxin stability system
MAIIAMKLEMPNEERQRGGTEEPAKQIPDVCQRGEEIIIRDRNLPVAKLVPLSPEEATEGELLLLAAGKMRLPKSSIDLGKVLGPPTGRSPGRAGTAALLKDRAQSLSASKPLFGTQAHWFRYVCTSPPVVRHMLNYGSSCRWCGGGVSWKSIAQSRESIASGR